MFAELKRLINNLVNVGTITQTKSSDGKALVKVKIIDRQTDFLPLVSFSNSFKKHFIPARVGEQVVVFCPFGEANGGFVLRSIFNTKAKEPNGSNDHTEVIEYEDGTRITYDTQAHELKIDVLQTVNIICKTAFVVADTVDITADTTNNGKVKVNGTLEVTDRITGGNGISITGGNDIGGASFDCDINAKDINASGEITDSKGSLTNHTNNSYARD